MDSKPEICVASQCFALAVRAHPRRDRWSSSMFATRLAGDLSATVRPDFIIHSTRRSRLETERPAASLCVSGRNYCRHKYLRAASICETARRTAPVNRQIRGLGRAVNDKRSVTAPQSLLVSRWASSCGNFGSRASRAKLADWHRKSRPRISR